MGSNPDEVIEFFPNYLILPVALWPQGADCLEGEEALLDISQPCRPPRPVTELASFTFMYFFKSSTVTSHLTSAKLKVLLVLTTSVAF
jgi:hypothetical protein